MAQDHLFKVKKYAEEHFAEPKWHKYKAILLSSFQMLADNPELGRPYDEIHHNSLYFPVGKHIAYYTKETAFILIVAVLGRSQIPQRHLK